MDTAVVVEPVLSLTAADREYIALSLPDSGGGKTLEGIDPSPLFVLIVVVLLHTAWFALTAAV